MNNIRLFNGDCLEVMDRLIHEGIKVDAIITDPPYGTTNNKWDSMISFDSMWARLDKLIKPNGAVVLFGSEPFTTKLNNSNINNFKYEWIWIKNNSTGFVNARRMPLKKHEKISVFYKKQCTYNPQGLVPYGKINKRGSMGNNWNSGTKNEYIQEYTNYPTQLLEFKLDKEKKHPTQKPIALMEYLVKTYTNEGELVLDFTMGSGSTGVACMNTNRKFIGIELDPNYFKIAENRICNTVINEEADNEQRA